MIPTCRFCGSRLELTFVDLGEMPPANAYLPPDADLAVEASYPLHARVCDECFLVQVDDVVSREEIFCDYAYFSSYSATWVDHARRFAEAAVRDLSLTGDSLVIEVASNDGYLLRHLSASGVPVLGVEPAANVAEFAIAAGVPTEVAFFGTDTAADLVRRGHRADLVVANNVLAHVPDLNDFVAGLVTVLAPDGVVSIEVPHLLRLIQRVAFDTIYHEHFSYFSLLTARKVLGAHALDVFDVEELATHGGSLRIWAAHAGHDRGCSERVSMVCEEEISAGLHDRSGYEGFAERVERCRRSLRAFLANAASGGASVAAYGAAAKGNTLLNFCGIGPGDVSYVVDRNPHKQGLLLPGSHLPIHPPDEVARTRPDYLLVLPWNLRDEILEQMSHVRRWGGSFVVPVPEVEVVA